MGKRVVTENPDSHHHQHVTPVTTGQRNIRKRKCNSNITNSKNLRMNSSHDSYWHENDDEDSSSNDGPPLDLVTTPRNASSKQANNSSILLNNSLNLSLTQNDNNSSLTESPKPVYTLRPSVVNGTIMYDLTQKPWRLGRPIGKGNFGEIFLASDNISIPVTNENAKFVVKIEPHSNGPLFVEIHCLMNTAKKNYEKHVTEAAAAACSNIPKGEPSGIPDYIASGSHYFGNARYRFLVLPRFDRDLHSLIKKCRVHQKSVLTLAIHIINVLENLHDRGYCHNDVKAQNLMISKCKYLTQQQKQKKTTTTTTTDSSSVFSNRGNVVAIGKEKRIKATTKYDDNYDEKQQTTDSGNSSEQEANDDDDEDFVVKRKVYNSKDLDRDYEEEDDDESPAEDDDDEDEDFDDGATTNSMNSNSMDMYQTPLNRNKQHQRVKGKKTSARNVVQYSGSNPVRSCRREKTNTIYDEMVKSHYLRPTKRISYSEFFNEDGVSVKSHETHDENSNSYSDMHSNSSDDESEEFVPLQVRRSIRSTAKKSFTTNMVSRRLTRRQEKLLGINNNNNNTNTKRENQANNEDDQHKIKTERNYHQHHQEQTEKQEWYEVNEERIFLIDYGLASKYIDNGVHRPFVMDQRRAHDGTLEFTSRDAHMGAHSRRSDMECLGYNLLFWSQGYLPWKEAATNQQQEKVHRAKEFLMTDVRELLRQIYGKQVPKYLGEYLHLVGQLAYHERPDYARYRNLFEREYQHLGYSLNDLSLNMHEIQTTCVRVKEEIENKNDFFETNKNNGVPCNMVLNIMQNLSVGGTPFHERTLSNRVSPKNLRSKSDKKGPKQKKFSWTEILSQDPDQIARERAEKEFDREEELSEVQQPMVRRYQGKPTTAIILILALLGRSSSEYEEETARLEREYKRKHHKVEKMEVDECDNGKNNNIDEDMKEDADEDDEEYHGQSGDENETDATETSEQNARHKSIQKQRTAKRSKTTKATTSGKTSNVIRKLILKTPNNEATNNNNNTSLTVTPVCARTRGKKANTTAKKSTKTTNTKLAKSTKKRGSAIKSVGQKSATGTTSGTAATAASAAGEIEQNQEIKRERRTRRRLLNADLQAMESHDDDSNSNLSPDIWKMNTEVIYSRNCKK
ncbi:back seat driver isoform 2-T3 [Cochliomyia hominivorax]